MEAIQDENFSADYSPLTFPPEITEVVASSGILQFVLAKANLPEDKVMTVLVSASKPSHKVQPLLKFDSGIFFYGRDDLLRAGLFFHRFFFRRQQMDFPDSWVWEKILEFRKKICSLRRKFECLEEILWHFTVKNLLFLPKIFRILAAKFAWV